MNNISKSINFVFGIHNHQPVGNFDFVIKDACERAYRPFLEVLDAHPSLKIAMHFTGVLLDWIIDNQPDIIDTIKKLVDRGQLEIMSGAYYEPILNTIPERDRHGQIEKLTALVRQKFNFRAEGMWLAERVWEPSLPGSLTAAGIRYTVIDDTHFKYAGLSEDQLSGYYLTEDLGSPLAIFPISKALRYTIPFQDPQVTIDLLHAKASEDGKKVMVFADDGEKFGIWPNTYNHVYEQRWLDRFFQLLEDNSQWIQMRHFNQILDEIHPLGRIYLPTASYEEMQHWALFPDKYREYEKFVDYLGTVHLYDQVQIFVRGGFWRNFLVKYSEINDMHKKMLYVSNKVAGIAADGKPLLKDALTCLWKGQCNCAYWHGVFGGLYLSHLRDAIYENLIRAEDLADRLSGKKFPSLDSTDIDADGYKELLVGTEMLNAYFRPQRGGHIYELDYKPLAKNLLDTLTRREEGYHARLKEAAMPGEETEHGKTASIHDLILTKEADLSSKLHYDFYERKSFIDHFLPDGTTLAEFAAAAYQESGDFIDEPYTLTANKIGIDQINLKLERKGKIHDDGLAHALKLSKNFRIANKKAHIIAEYSLENLSANPLDLWFGVELNFGLQAGHADDRFYYADDVQLENKFLDSTGNLAGSRFIGMKDLWRGLDIQVSVSKKSDIWRFPIETISMSEGGFEKVYQSSVIFPNWQIKLVKSWQVQIELQINNLKEK